MWCKPVMPHLHDPYTLGDSYFDVCFERVRQAVRKLSADLPLAHGAGPAGSTRRQAV
jgi:protein-tyrosine phosphatase